MKPAVVEVCRGGMVESKHYVHLIVVDGTGKTIFSLGEKDYITYWRSAAKPFQVIPLLEAGGKEKFKLNNEEIALMTGSHSGEKAHLHTLSNILKKIGIEKDLLDCGIGAPMSAKEAERILRAGEKFEAAHNACSGKHAAMLALCKIMGVSLINYRLLGHPIQQIILDTIAQSVQLAKEDIITGIDGCGVPVFRMPIYNMALAYAHLSTPSQFLAFEKANILEQILQAMVAKPFYVAGTDMLDTILMEATNGKIVAKIGAEAVYCVGIVDQGVGIALKVMDGNLRAIGPVIIQVLKKLGYLNDREYQQLLPLVNPVVKNHRGDLVGELRLNLF